jgi:hypothetical protein
VSGYIYCSYRYLFSIDGHDMVVRCAVPKTTHTNTPNHSKYGC